MARKSETKFVIGAEDQTKATLRTVSANFKALGKQVDQVGRSLSRNLTAPIVGVATGLGLLGKGAITSADQMKKLSTRLGISVKALSEYKFAAQQSGIEFNTLTMSIQRMTRRISEAAKGTGEARGALRELGLSATEMAQLAPEQQFAVLADAIDGVEGSADKVRIAMKLFDSEGVSLLQMMKGGSEAMRLQAEIASRLGIVIDDDLASASENLTNKFGVLKNQILGVGVSVAKFLLPYLNEFADRASVLIEYASKLSSEQLKWLGIISGTAAAIGPLLLLIGKMTQLMPMITSGVLGVKKSFTLLKGAMIGVSSTILVWVAIVGAALAAIFIIWANFGDDIKGFMKKLWDGITDTWSSLLNWLNGAVQTGLQAVADAWTWLKDSITTIMKPVLQWLGDAFSTVINTILGMFSKLVGGLAGLSKKIGDALGIEKLKEAGAAMEGFSQTLANTKVNLPEIGKSIVEKIKDAIGDGATAVANFDWSSAWGSFTDGLGDQKELLQAQFADMLSGLGLDKAKIDQIKGLLGFGDTSGAATNAAVAPTGEDETGTEPSGEKVLSFGARLEEQFTQMKTFAEQAADAMLSTFNEVADGISKVMGDALGDVATNMLGLTEGPIMVGRAFKKMAADVIKNLAGVLVKMFVMWAISKALGFSVGKLPSPGSLSNGLTGALADGGPAKAGGSYLVGERGPEIFTPKTSGVVTPNHQLGNQEITNTYNFEIISSGDIFTDPLTRRRVAEAINDEIIEVQKTYLQPA